MFCSFLIFFLRKLPVQTSLLIHYIPLSKTQNACQLQGCWSLFLPFLRGNETNKQKTTECTVCVSACPCCHAFVGFLKFWSDQKFLMFWGLITVAAAIYHCDVFTVSFQSCDSNWHQTFIDWKVYKPSIFLSNLIYMSRWMLTVLLMGATTRDMGELI